MCGAARSAINTQVTSSCGMATVRCSSLTLCGFSGGGGCVRVSRLISYKTIHIRSQMCPGDHITHNLPICFKKM